MPCRTSHECTTGLLESFTTIGRSRQPPSIDMRVQGAANVLPRKDVMNWHLHSRSTTPAHCAMQARRTDTETLPVSGHLPDIPDGHVYCSSGRPRWQLMRNRTIMIAWLVALFSACGDDGGGTDSGTGTHTLSVQGRVSWVAEEGAAEMSVSVR